MRIFVGILFTFITSMTLTAQDYDIYLLIGQSNMAGRGELSVHDLDAIEGVWLLNPEGEIEPASNPMNKYSSIRKDIKMQKMSPACAFGKTLHKKTGKKILLIVNARGGSTIEEWEKGNKGTHFYEEALRRAKASSKYGDLKAIIWHQGESNASHPQDYLPKLSAFVTHLRHDLNKPDLPFVAGEIAQWNEYAKKINPKIQSIPAIINHSAYITSVGAQPLKDFNDPHFSRSGSNLMGWRYAYKILEMVYNIRP